MEQASKNNKSQPKTQSEPSHNSQYFTADPIDKETLKQRIAEDKKITSYKRVRLLGFFMMLFSIPLYLISRTVVYSGCTALGCAFYDLGALLISIVILIIGLSFVIINTMRLRKNKN